MFADQTQSMQRPERGDALACGKVPCHVRPHVRRERACRHGGEGRGEGSAAACVRTYDTKKQTISNFRAPRARRKENARRRSRGAHPRYRQERQPQGKRKGKQTRKSRNDKRKANARANENAKAGTTHARANENAKADDPQYKQERQRQGKKGQAPKQGKAYRSTRVTLRRRRTG